MSAKHTERARKIRQYRNARLHPKPAVIFTGEGVVLRGAGRNNFAYGPNRQLEHYQKVAASRRAAKRKAEEAENG